MVWETEVIYLTIAMYLVGLLLVLLRMTRPGRLVFIAASLPSTLLFAVNVESFLANDFALQAVYQNSSTSLALPFRLAASWTAAGGSLLLLVAMMSVGLLVYEARALLIHEGSRVTSIVVSSLIIYFLIAVVAVNPFARFGFSPANGLGLNPSLQSYWTLVHPPTVFSAYTVTLFAFSTLLSKRWSGRADQLADKKLLAGSWALLTLGITLGAAWAYQTSGWGGYWAWDPIETAALIPWLVLTAVLLARPLANRNFELFGMTFSMSALLFTSYIARGSAAPSVHSYGELASGAPLILLAFFPIFFSLATVAKSRGRGDVVARFELGSIYSYEFLCLSIIAACNLGLLLLESFAPIFGVMFPVSEQLHNLVSFPLVVAFVALLLAECVRPVSRIRYALAALLLLGVGFVLRLTSLLGPNLLLALGLPFAGSLLVGGFYGLARTSGGGRKATLHTASRYVIFVGMALLLLGVLFSSSMRTTAASEVGPSDAVSLGGVKLTVLSIVTTPSQGRVYMPGYGSVPETIDTSVNYALAGQPGTFVTLLKYYPALDEFYSVPSIYGTLTSDEYIVAGTTSSVDQASSLVFKDGGMANPSNANMSIQTIPGIWLVWSGVAVMVLAGLPYLFGSPSNASAVALSGDLGMTSSRRQARDSS